MVIAGGAALPPHPPAIAECRLQIAFETMNTPLRPYAAISVERILKCQLCQECSKKH